MQVLLLLVHHLRSQDHQQQVCVLDQLQESNNDMVTANPSVVLQQDEVCPKSTHGMDKNGIPIFQLSMVDVADELAYWEMGVVAYVLGFHPNVKLFEGYCHRLWGKNNVDKVIPIKKGIFLIRFLNTESKTKALQMHNLMLDNRPVFLKQWHDGMEFSREEFYQVPVWVQLPALPIKYWGQNFLSKIVGLLGEPVKADAATANRDIIGYARFLVEMNINGDGTVWKMSENGVMLEQEVVYEWKPVKCNVCGLLGHVEKQCKKKQSQQQVWKPKVKQPEVPVKTPEVSHDEEIHSERDPIVDLKEVRRHSKPIEKRTPDQNQCTPLSNTFQVLQETAVLVGQVPVCKSLSPGMQDIHKPGYG